MHKKINRDRHLFSLSSPMQRRKGRQGDRLFAPPSLTVLKYRDSEGLRGKLINRCLSLLLLYAGNIGVEVVMGSDHKLKISLSEKINVPGKGTKERESLIELLSQLNRLEEVSAFDVAELKKAIKEEKWDSDILDEIKKFVEIETVKSVRLSKSKRED